MIQKSLLIILPATNFNEQEFLIVKNTFEKAGYKIFIASDSYSLCNGSNGLKVRADVSFFNIHEKNFSAIVFIGGYGVAKYWENTALHSIAKSFHKNRKPVAAICSAPVILAKAGLLSKIEATCHSSNKKDIERCGAIYKDSPVVVSENIITASGPAVAADFTKAIINQVTKRFASV